MYYISDISEKYSCCPKSLNTKVSDKMAYTNSADPDQKRQSYQGVHYLPFH